jgi:hypothetical protein
MHAVTLLSVLNLQRVAAVSFRVVFASLSKPQMELTVELARLGVVEHQPDRQHRESQPFAVV